MYYNMQTIVKQTREVGTSAGVLLPRSWLNKQVVVTLFSPSKEEITKEILDILLKKNLNEEIKGIYLFGSYARGDYSSDSDIDVLVITQKTSKLIDEGNYEITLLSEENFSKGLLSGLYYQSIIREIKVLVNRELMEKYSFKKYDLNLRKSLSEIERIFEINKDIVEICMENNKNIPDGIIYSLVLRLRELFIIKCLVANKRYNKKSFIEITSEKVYLAYSRVKRDKKDVNDISPDEAINILNLTQKWLKDLKGLKRELKV